MPKRREDKTAKCPCFIKSDLQLDTIYHHPPLSFRARSMVHNSHDVDISSSSSHKILTTSTLLLSMLYSSHQTFLSIFELHDNVTILGLGKLYIQNKQIDLHYSHNHSSNSVFLNQSSEKNCHRCSELNNEVINLFSTLAKIFMLNLTAACILGNSQVCIRQVR